MSVNEPTNLVDLLIALLAIIASKEIAALVGPYAAIIVLATSGAALSLSGHEDTMTRSQAIGFVGIRILVAVTLTISIAELMQNIIPWAKPRYMLVPLAFGIGWIRDYASVRQWVGSVIERFVGKRLDDDPK